MSPVRRLAALLLVLVAGGVAGCGGPSDEGASSRPERAVADVLAQVEGLSGEAREQRLLELVEEEGGALDFYTGLAAGAASAVASAFEDAYGVDVALYRARSETVLRRIVEEVEADFGGADVVHMNGYEIGALAEEGALDRSYTSAAEEALPDGAYVDPWTAVQVSTYVVVRNTELVPEADAPRSWRDLADPRWEGAIAVDPDDVDWFAALWEHLEDEGLSEADVGSTLEAIAANTVFVPGHTLAAELVGAGEFALNVNLRHVASRVAEEGSPIAWEPLVVPVIARQSGTAPIVNTRHPATAVLFVDWLLGDGQQVLAEEGIDPIAAGLPTGGTILVDEEAFAASEEEWRARFDALIRLGTAFEG